jgi:site-specific DNA recombinase
MPAQSEGRGRPTRAAWSRSAGTFAYGRTCGGVPFSRGAIHHLLTNPVYIGGVRHKNQVYPGQHPPLIARATCDPVHDALQVNANRPRRG